MKVSELWTRLTGRNLAKKESIYISPGRRNLSGGFASNSKLLNGLYDGSAQEFNLASYITQSMINIPKALVGIPVMVCDNEDADKLIKELEPLIIDEFPIITTTMLLHGTAWRWARWSDKSRRLVWEAIPDDCVISIIVDKDDGEITELYTDENLTFNKTDKVQENLRRKRHFTKTLITEELTGSINKTIKYKNTFGYLPVPFGHDVFEGEWRGNSVFSKVLRLIKDLHDISYQRDRILADFTPKIIQTVNQSGVKTWIENNNNGSKDGYDPYGRDFVLNQIGEATQFLSIPSDATAQHTDAIKELLLRIVAGSGLPQIFHGEAVSGNYATSDNQLIMGAEYIKSLRREMSKATLELINQSLTIISFVRFMKAPSVKISWDELNLMTSQQKAAVLSSYASGMSQLSQSAVTSKEGLYYFTKMIYQDFPAADAEHLLEGLKEMLIEHSSRLGAASIPESDF